MEQTDTDRHPADQAQVLRAERESARANAAARARQMAARIQEEQKSRQTAQLQARARMPWRADEEGPLRTAQRSQNGAAAAPQAPRPAVYAAPGAVDGEPWARCLCAGLALLTAGGLACPGTFIIGLGALFHVSLPLAAGSGPLSMLLAFFASALAFVGARLLSRLPAKQRSPAVNALLLFARPALLIGSCLHFLGVLLILSSQGTVIQSMGYTVFLAGLNFVVYMVLDLVLEKYLLNVTRE